MSKADYSYTIEGDTVKIIDLNKGNMSVTNDAENVINEIAQKEYIQNKRITYRDSEGDWCELIPTWNEWKCVNVDFKF